MSKICSVCLETTNRATPLYWKHGNMWTDTGLSEMLKSCQDENIKIKKKTETCALHVMCNNCIYKTCLTFFTKKNNSTTEPPPLSKYTLVYKSCIRYLLILFICFIVKFYNKVLLNHPRHYCTMNQ